MKLDGRKYYLIVIPWFLLVLSLVSCSVQRQAIITTHGVDKLLELPLNGVEQAVVIRGVNVNNPVLVHIHGGPGYPLFPFIDDFKSLEEHFTMVYWEQRGTGKSLHSKVKSSGMVTDTLIADLNQLVQFVKNELHVEQVMLWGHSWGTNLGMLYASRYPENVSAYIGTGQSVNLLENERLCMKYAIAEAEKAANEKALKQLNKIDTLNYQLKDALAVRKWVYTYGGIVHQVNKEKSYINFDIVKDVFATPEYSGVTKWRIMFKSKYSGKNLWEDMMVINLFEQVTSVAVPIYFFLGRYDHIVSSQLAAEYFDYVEAAKGKQHIWFNESAHRPQTEEPDKFLKELLLVKSHLSQIEN